MKIHTGIVFLFLFGVFATVSFAEERPVETPVAVVSVFFTPGQGLDWLVGDIDTAFNQAKVLVEQNIPANIKAKVNITYIKETDATGHALKPPQTLEERQKYIQHTRGLYNAGLVKMIFLDHGAVPIAQQMNYQVKNVAQAIAQYAISPVQSISTYQADSSIQSDQALSDTVKKGISLQGTKSISLRVDSRGEDSTRLAHFYLNGSDQMNKFDFSRGIGIVVLNPVTGEVDNMNGYDTWADYSEALQTKIKNFIDSIPNGYIVLTAMKDYNHMNAQVIQAFKNALGSQYADIASGWDSWAMITQKGAIQSIAEKWIDSPPYPYSPGMVTVSARVPLVSSSDKTPPAGTMRINNGDSQINDTSVILDLSDIFDTESGLTSGGRMRFSNDGKTWSPAEQFKTSKPWYFQRGSGLKTIYGQFRDHDGNWSKAITAQVKLVEDAAPHLVTSQTPSDHFYYSTTACADRNGNAYVVFGVSRYPYTVSPQDIYFRSSRDHGKTWSKTMSIFKKVEDNFSDEMSCDDQGHVYAIISQKKGKAILRISSDYSKTWLSENITVGADVLNINNPKIVSNNNNEVYIFWKTDAGQVYLSTSMDAGQTWQSKSTNLEGVDEVSVNAKGQLYVVWRDPSDIYFSKSMDHGRSWLNSPIVLNKGEHSQTDYDGIGVYADDNGNVYTAWSVEGGIYVIGLYGQTWATWGISGGTYFTASHDYGSTWPSSPVSINSVEDQLSIRGDWMDVSADNSGLVAVLRNSGRNTFMNYSIDFGRTWQSRNILTTTALYATSGNDSSNIQVFIRVLRDRIESFWNQVKTDGNAYDVWMESRPVSNLR